MRELKTNKIPILKPISFSDEFGHQPPLPFSTPLSQDWIKWDLHFLLY